MWGAERPALRLPPSFSPPEACGLRLALLEYLRVQQTRQLFQAVDNARAGTADQRVIERIDVVELDGPDGGEAGALAHAPGAHPVRGVAQHDQLGIERNDLLGAELGIRPGPRPAHVVAAGHGDHGVAEGAAAIRPSSGLIIVVLVV